MGKFPITRIGADLLKAELHRLKTVERPAVITAIAEAKDPVLMAEAMRDAVSAGRKAFLAGRIPMKLHAAASSPI